MRRAVALIASLTVPLVALTACGDDADSEGAGSVQVSGEFGEEPTVEYDGRITRTETQVTVLEEGDGPVVPEGGAAFLHYYIGNGYTAEKAISTWDQPEAPGGKNQGGKKPEEQPRYADLVVDGSSTWPAVRDAMVGAKAGSRLLILSTPKDSFSERGAPGIGVGNQDSVVWVVDIMSTVLSGPEGEQKDVPAGLPAVVESGGKVTALDFADAPETAPSEFQVVPLVEGTGPEVVGGAPVAVRYLGHVWGAEEKFDENYTDPFPGFTNPQNGTVQPAVFGEGGYIEAWDEGIPGVRVGSRVMLVVPPEKGYGKQKRDKIPRNSTLVFVVDVLGQG